jgi:shikimate kinase
MGSGKSTVGARLAERLGWSFFDFDLEIERRSGVSVEALFATRGEGVFRGLEAEVADELLASDLAVLASGGGWPATPGSMEGLGADTLSVWLQVDPETSLARVWAADRVRPLLNVPDPEKRARDLLRERAQRYRLATLHVDSQTGSPEHVAGVVFEYLEKNGQRPVQTLSGEEWRNT